MMLSRGAACPSADGGVVGPHSSSRLVLSEQLTDWMGPVTGSLVPSSLANWLLSPCAGFCG